MREAMRAEIEIADDGGIEQADGVARDRVAKARMEFLRYRRAADDGVFLQHDNAQARAGEIGRTGQAVVAGADDGDIELICAHGLRLNENDAAGQSNAAVCKHASARIRALWPARAISQPEILMSKPHLLMTGPMMPLIENGCDAAFTVHRLHKAAGPRGSAQAGRA